MVFSIVVIPLFLPLPPIEASEVALSPAVITPLAVGLAFPLRMGISILLHVVFCILTAP